MSSNYLAIHGYRLSLIENQIDSLGLTSNAKILDIGCYPPYLLKSLSKRFQLWGISSGHEPVSFRNVSTINIDNETFPYSDNFFDLVIFSEVLEHMYRGVDHIFSEINRILKPGGRLIITTPNAVRSHNLLKIIVGVNPFDGLNNDSIYHRHNREYTQSELLALSRSSDFSPVLSQYIIAYPPFRNKVIQEPLWLQLIKWLNYFFTLLFKSRRDTLLLISQK
ncbi:MAG: class I SAM-dependent methyltransferase [Candidatus Shapirobacteria bacterium]|jgi:SAM-dependent methyltransferase